MRRAKLREVERQRERASAAAEADARRAELERADQEEEEALHARLVALSTQRAREREAEERMMAGMPAADWPGSGRGGGLPPPERVAEVLAARAADLRSPPPSALRNDGEGVGAREHTEWVQGLRASAEGALGRRRDLAGGPSPTLN